MKSLIDKLRFSSKLVFLIIGLVILYSYAMFQGNFVSWFLFYSFLPFVFYSVVLAFYPLKMLEIERIVDQNMYEAGDRALIKLKILRKIPFPIYFLLIEEKLPASISFHNKKMLFPLFKREIIGSFEVSSLSRGEHFFEEVKIMTADFFGLIKKEHAFRLEDKVVVYPKLQRISLLSLVHKAGDGIVAKGLAARKEQMIPISVRDYEPGDRLSWINWKMTAKKNNPMTKEFEKTEDRQLVIWMDRSKDSHINAFEKIVQYTGSLIHELTRASVPVDLISVGKEDRPKLHIKKSSDWEKQLLYHLAIVKNDSPLALARLLDHDLPHLPSRGTIVFVTEYADDNLLLKLVNKLASNSYKIVVMVASAERLPLNSGRLFPNQNIIVELIDEQFAREAIEVKLG